MMSSLEFSLSLLRRETGREISRVFFELNSVQQLLPAIMFMQPLLMWLIAQRLAAPLRYFLNDGGFACLKSGVVVFG